MRIVMLATLVVVSLSAQAATFRYRAFVPKAQDCNAEVASLKSRFEQSTGLKVQSTQCAPVVISVTDNQDIFEANAATLLYTSSRDVRVNSVRFGHGSAYGLQGSVGIAGDTGGAYETQADCQADLANQTSIFKTQTGADVLAASCVPPSMGGGRFNLEIDSTHALAKQLYVLEAFDDETSADSFAHVQQLVAAEGVTVARASNNAVYFYDSGTSDRPANMRVRSVQAGLFNEGAECTQQVPALAQILKSVGLANFEATCSGVVGTSSLVVVGVQADRLSINAFNRGDYTSLAECKADETRASDELRRKGGRGFASAYCVLIDPLDTVHAYGLETVYSK